MSRRMTLPPAVQAVALAALLVLPSAARAAEPSAPAAGKPAPSGRTLPDPLAAAGLPHYEPPAAYRVNLVVDADGQHVTMKRFVDGGRIRTETSGAGGQESVMIEAGDERGTSYILMPAQKRAIKQSRAAMEEMRTQMAPQAAAAAPEEAQAPLARFKVEALGEETVEGHTLEKMRFSSPEGSALGWFDKATGAPARLESTAEGHKSVLTWQDLEAGPQPAALFEVPKGYEVMDMDQMMAQMKSAAARSGLAGGGGMPGMGVGAGMARGMASGMAENYGQSMGSRFGAGFGAALGGPLGAIAGQYIGGRLGGMVARKATGMMTPKPSIPVETQK